jgi:hypothetical protein
MALGVVVAVAAVSSAVVLVAVAARGVIVATVRKATADRTITGTRILTLMFPHLPTVARVAVVEKLPVRRPLTSAPRKVGASESGWLGHCIWNR